MSGYITYWSKDYVKQLKKHNDNGPFRVVYGSQHTRMPYITKVKVGDIIYPVTIKEHTLCVMARLPIDVIEPAYDYLMRETGKHFAALLPEGILLQKNSIYGQFNTFSGGSGYTGKVTLPDNIHTVIQEESLVEKPHLFHQEPITCCAKNAASGSNGSSILERIIPLGTAVTFRFGSTPSSQKPLKLDKDGYITSLSLSGFVRKMDDAAFDYFEKLFDE